jgi:ubiquinone biosynthesis protein UbiJ
MSLNTIPSDLRNLITEQLCEQDRWSLLIAASRIEQLEQEVKLLKEKADRLRANTIDRLQGDVATKRSGWDGFEQDGPNGTI